jgi:hypothetical protein
MNANLSSCAEVAGPVCLALAERWNASSGNMDECERHNLEMATIFILRWISSGDQRAERNLLRAAALLH